MKKSYTLVLISYVVWGLFPLFWNLLSSLNSLYILASRVVWSAIFCGLILMFMKKRASGAFKDKKEFFLLLLCGVLVTINWGTYIAAVTSGHVLEGSFAYYLSPLVSVIIGAVFYKEKLGAVQWISVGIATVGVLYSVVGYGKIPWLALIMAVTFAAYGALKKKVRSDAETSLFVETLCVSPVALAFIIYSEVAGNGAVGTLHGWQFILLPLAGIVTSAPLWLFSAGMKETPCTLSGIMMYINPTLQLLCGVLLMGEQFTSAEAVTFSLVWIAIIIYLTGTFVNIRKKALLPNKA